MFLNEVMVRFSVRKIHLARCVLMLFAHGACCVWGAARASGDQSSNGAPSVGTTGAVAPASSGRPPLWRVYYDDGVKAMLGRDYKRAIESLGKAKHDLAYDRKADEPELFIDIAKRLGTCYVELAKVEKSVHQRENQLLSARQSFGQARDQIEVLYGTDSPEFADASEQLADVRSLNAEERRGAIKSYLGALAPASDKKDSVSDLYIMALTTRERILGEGQRDVMLYRRKVLRQVQSWLRTSRELRRDVTDIKVQYEVDPIIEGLKVLADELKQRDRALSRGADASSNGEHPVGAP